MINHLKDLIKSFSQADVRFIICGGVAVVLHGVERMTLDLDLAVDMDRSNLQKFLGVMRDEKMVPRSPVDPNQLLDEAFVDRIVREKQAIVFTFVDLKNPYRQVDIFLTKENSYNELRNHTVPIWVDKMEVQLISKEKLIEMKKQVVPVREKDVLDIKALERKP